MPESYRIRIAKEEIVFSAGHFITFNGNVCERLHGHNYHVAVELEAALDENHYVVDFVATRAELQRLAGELDHRMLLPTQHPLIQVRADDQEVEARFEERRWVFPRGDCVLLPVKNTTAELLATYLAAQLRAALREKLGFEPRSMRVEVDECFGQLGIYEWRGETTSGE